MSFNSIHWFVVSLEVNSSATVLEMTPTSCFSESLSNTLTSTAVSSYLVICVLCVLKGTDRNTTEILWKNDTAVPLWNQSGMSSISSLPECSYVGVISLMLEVVAGLKHTRVFNLYSFLLYGLTWSYASQITSHTCTQTSLLQGLLERELFLLQLWIAAVTPPHILWSGFVLQGTRKLRDYIRPWFCNYWFSCSTSLSTLFEKSDSLTIFTCIEKKT